MLTYPVSHLPATGKSHLDKISRVREELDQKKAKAIVVTMLDEVAWLFNLRGSDIDFNPGIEIFCCNHRITTESGPQRSSVFFAYAVVTHDDVILFIDGDQLDDSVRKHLGEDIKVQPYSSFFQYLKGLPQSLGLSEAAVSS